MEDSLCLIGCGNMGGAMARGWVSSGYDRGKITFIDPHFDPLFKKWADGENIRCLANIEDWRGEKPDFILIALKPQNVDSVLPKLADLLSEENVLLSVAAGKTIAGFERVFAGRKLRIVRVMSNTPAQVGRAMSVCADNGRVSEGQKAIVNRLMGAIGAVEWVGDESLMDAVTAVSGSGPAYLFYLTETLAQAGEKAGLPADLAEKLAIETMSGAGELMRQSTLGAAKLRENVTSPNGTTEQALGVLMEKENGLPSLLERAVKAATDRSRELASESAGDGK